MEVRQKKRMKFSLAEKSEITRDVRVITNNAKHFSSTYFFSHFIVCLFRFMYFLVRIFIHFYSVVFVSLYMLSLP
jgi:hypothetical protein